VEPRAIFDDGTGLRLTGHGPVFFVHFYGPPTTARMVLVENHQVEFTARHPRYAIVSVVEPSVGVDMSSEARQKARDVGDRFQNNVIASAYVILGTGFLAALARSVIAGVYLLRRQAHPYVVTKDPVEGARFVAGHLDKAGLAIDVEAIARGVDETLKREVARA
jgi:hypothetical protein